MATDLPQLLADTVNALPQEEFCPRCGQWVNLLDDYSGWCTPCATSTTLTAESKPCSRCGTVLGPEGFASVTKRGVRNRVRAECRRCETVRKREWRAANRGREQAYNAARVRGACGVCGRSRWLRGDGLIGVHRTVQHESTAPRCAGSGQPPQEAAK